jgi:son of sevenless
MMATTPPTTRPRAPSNPDTPPLIVRAVYDYTSSDTSNLSFTAGTLIRVLTQLQSGWWDGCVDGERGWFPCNFVTIVEDGDDDEFDEEMSISGDEDVDVGEAALAGSGLDGDGRDSTRIADEIHWIPQADKEGRTYFFNTLNGATSWELPGQQVFLEDWDEPSRLSDDEVAPRSSVDSENSGEILMLGPTRQDFNVSPYHCLVVNVVAFVDRVRVVESFFSSSFVFGRIRETSLLDTNLPRSSTRSNIWYFPSPTPLNNLDSLLPPLRIAVDRLSSSAKAQSRQSFTTDTDAVVSAVARISASIPREHKDSHIERYIHYNRYRPMVAALCSLVTSTKLASGDWSPEAQIRKMDRDSQEVLHKAEQFLEYARETADIHPRRIKPFFMTRQEGDGKTGGGWTENLGGGGVEEDHLSRSWNELEMEKENVERCVKALGLPNQTSGRGRKNSVVIVDEHLSVPFLLVAVQVSHTPTHLLFGLIKGIVNCHRTIHNSCRSSRPLPLSRIKRRRSPITNISRLCLCKTRLIQCNRRPRHSISRTNG